MDKYWTGNRVEKLIAKICLWSLAVSVMVSLIPGVFFENKILVTLTAVLAAILFLSWIFLLGMNFYRFFFDKESHYSVLQIIAVLFIPILGAVGVSLHKVK